MLRDELGLELRNEWMFFLALRHLLPPAHLKTVLDGMVASSSEGEIELGELFEFKDMRGLAGLDGLLAKPLRPTGAGWGMLQRLVKSVLWQGDGAAYFGGEESSRFLGVEIAYSFGAIDFGSIGEYRGWLQRHRSLLQESFVCLAECLFAAWENWTDESKGESVGQVLARLSGLSGLYRAMAAKHIGDIHADSDSWLRAREYYRAARDTAKGVRGRGTQGSTKYLRGLIECSLTTAEGTLSGSPEARRMREDAIRSRSFGSDPVAHSNLSQQLVDSAVESREFSFFDERTICLVAPGLVSQVEIGVALARSNEGRFDDAHRWFWASLRRLIALGADERACDVRAAYAQSLVAQAVAMQTHEPVELALRLFVEAGRFEAIRRVPGHSWEHVVGMVDEGTIERLLESAERYPGRRFRRTRTLVELLVCLFRALPAESRDLRVRMWRDVAALAARYEADLLTTRDVGGAALEALRQFAEYRPELRHEVADQVLSSALNRLTCGGFWRNRDQALKVIDAYWTSLPAERVGALVGELCQLLETLDEQGLSEPSARRVVELLTSDQAVQFLSADRQLALRTAKAELRFGLCPGGSPALALAAVGVCAESLGDVFGELRGDSSKLEAQVRQRLNAVGSSALPGLAHALLVAGKICDPSAQLEAVDALSALLREAQKREFLPGMVSGYTPVLWMARDNGFRERLGSDGELRLKVGNMFAELLAIWHIAAERPLMFGGFSIPPPREPDPIITYNWAVASLELGEVLGEGRAVRAALEQARSLSSIATPVVEAMLGQQFFGVLDGPVSSDEVSVRLIGAKRADEYYSLLGFGVGAAAALSGDAQRDLVGIMLNKSLECGPREVDAGVFALAIEVGCRARWTLDLEKLASYRSRLRSRTEMAAHGTLHPLVALIGKLIVTVRASG